MKTITAVIVDDEPLARERVRELLETEDDVDVVGEASNGAEALTMIASEEPDLVFLDIQMPGLDGFAVLRELGQDRMPTVVFVTAFDEYAMQAFDAHAIDYLLKPFDRERFAMTLTRARDVMRGRAKSDLDARLASLLDELQPGPSYLDRVLVKTGGRSLLLRVEDIDWIEAAGNYLRLHVGRQRHLLRETMAGLESQLDPGRFVRVHRSSMVNLERIASFEPALHGDYRITLGDGRSLTLTRTYKGRMEEALGREL